MLTDYLILGVSPEAPDADIRKKYIQLIKQHPPEHDPDRFREISAAYDRIKNESARIRTRLFGPLEIKDPDETILNLIRAVRPKRQRVGLNTLLAACARARG